MLLALRSLWEQQVPVQIARFGGMPSSVTGIVMGAFVRIDMGNGKYLKIKDDPRSIENLAIRFNCQIDIV
jgi:hypothetical protein